VKQTSTAWKIKPPARHRSPVGRHPIHRRRGTDANVWDVATQRVGLDTEFGTPIVKSLTDVVTYLGL
jgi:hypothetical protein